MWKGCSKNSPLSQELNQKPIWRLFQICPWIRPKIRAVVKLMNLLGDFEEPWEVSRWLGLMPPCLHWSLNLLVIMSLVLFFWTVSFSTASVWDSLFWSFFFLCMPSYILSFLLPKVRFLILKKTLIPFFFLFIVLILFSPLSLLLFFPCLLI